MFRVGDLPVLTFGNCVLQTGVIKWPLKLYVSFLEKKVLAFFESKTRLFTFYELLLLHAFSRTLYVGVSGEIWYTRKFLAAPLS